MAQTPAQKKAVAKYQTKKFIANYATEEDASEIIDFFIEKFGRDIVYKH